MNVESYVPKASLYVQATGYIRLFLKGSFNASAEAILRMVTCIMDPYRKF